MKTDIKFRGLFALALPCLLALSASTTGCGDDDDDNNGDSAGAGGSSAGKGGSSSAGTAGKGSSGSATGGSKTDGGSAGKGSGGTTAGTGGTAGTVGNDGGAGGEPLVNPPVGGEGGAPLVEGGGAGGGENVDNGGAGGEGPLAEVTPLIFNPSGTGHDRFYGTTYDAAGNIYAVGQITTSNDATADISTLFAKFKPNGELDTTFGTNGYYTRNVAVGTNGELFRNIAVQSTGKIVSVGAIEHVESGADPKDRDIALIRLNANGTPDTTFGTDGVKVFDLSTGVTNNGALSTDQAWGLGLYSDDRIVISGAKVRTGGVDTDFIVARLSANGVLDDGFADHGIFSLDLPATGVDHNNASPRNVTILPGTDGIVGAGYQPAPGHDTSPVVYKVSDAGVLDDSFGDHGAFHSQLLAEQTECYQAVVQPITGGGYKLVTTGYGKEAPSPATTDLVSLRLSSSGVLDTTYGTGGIARIDIGGFNDNSRKVMILPDRRVLLVGGGRATSADVDGVVAVLTADGVADTTFAPNGFKLFDLGGPADFFWGVALSPDSKTLAIGGILGVGTSPTPATAADDAALLLLPTP